MEVYKMEEQNTPAVLDEIYKMYEELYLRFKQNTVEIMGCGVFLKRGCDISKATQQIESLEASLSKLKQSEDYNVRNYRHLMNEVHKLKRMYSTAIGNGDGSNTVVKFLSSVTIAMNDNPTTINIKLLCDLTELCNSAQTLLSISGDSVGSDYSELMVAAKGFILERVHESYDRVTQLVCNAEQLLRDLKAGNVSYTELDEKIEDIIISAPFSISRNCRMRYPWNINSLPKEQSNDLKQAMKRLVEAMQELRVEQHKQEMIQPETVVTSEMVSEIVTANDAVVTEEEKIESQQPETNVPSDTTVDINAATVTEVEDARDTAIHQDELEQHHTIVAVDQIEEPGAFVRFLQMILNLLFYHPNPNRPTPDSNPDSGKQQTEVNQQLEDTQELSDVVGELGQLE
jgi:hypothetical protein